MRTPEKASNARAGSESAGGALIGRHSDHDRDDHHYHYYYYYGNWRFAKEVEGGKPREKETQRTSLLE